MLRSFLLFNLLKILQKVRKKKSLKNLICFNVIPSAGFAYLVFKETSPLKKIKAKIENTKISRFIASLEENFINKAKNIHPDLFVNFEKIKENFIPVGSGSLFIIGQIVNKNNEIAQLEANISNQKKYKVMTKEMEEKKQDFVNRQDETLKLKNELASKEKYLTKMRKNVNEGFLNRKNVIEKLEKLNKEQADKINTLYTNSDNQNEQIAELTAENAQLKTELREMKNKFLYLTARDEEKHEKIQELQNKNHKNEKKKH